MRPDIQAIVDGAGQLNAWAGELTGLDFASERGWLGDAEEARRRDLDAEFPVVHQRLEALWHALPADAVRAFEDRVRGVLARMRAAGGKLGHFYLESLEPRATATLSPGRTFDFWAVWAIYHVD